MIQYNCNIKDPNNIVHLVTSLLILFEVYKKNIGSSKKCYYYYYLERKHLFQGFLHP